MKEIPRAWVVALVVLLAVAALGCFLWGLSARSDAVEARGEASAWRQKSARMQETLRGVEKQLKERSNALAEGDQALEAARERVRDLEGRFEKQQSALQEHRQSIEVRDRRISALEQEVAGLQERLENRKSKQVAAVSALEQRGRSLEADRNRVQADLEEARRVLREQEQEAERLRARLARKDQSCAEERTELKREIGELSVDLRESRKQCAGLRQRLVQARERQEALDNQKKALQTTYETLVQGLRQEVQDNEATVEKFRETLRVTFVDRILFGFSQVRIGEKGRAALDRLAGALAELPEGRIRIAGHADDVPVAEEFRYRFPSNWELSSARASAVARYLQKQAGLAPESMEVVGFSCYHPLASNATEEGRALNRRVEITITPAAFLPPTSPGASP